MLIELFLTFFRLPVLTDYSEYISNLDNPYGDTVFSRSIFSVSGRSRGFCGVHPLFVIY